MLVVFIDFQALQDFSSNEIEVFNWKAEKDGIEDF